MPPLQLKFHDPRCLEGRVEYWTQVHTQRQKKVKAANDQNIFDRLLLKSYRAVYILEPHVKNAPKKYHR